MRTEAQDRDPVTPRLLRLVDWFLPPAIRADPGAERQGRVIVATCLGLTPVGTLGTLSRAALPTSPRISVLVVGLGTLLAVVLPFLLKTTGRLRLVGNIAAVACVFNVAAMCFVTGGLDRPEVTIFAALPLFNAFLVDRRAGVLTAAAVCVILGLFLLAHARGWSVPSPFGTELQQLTMRAAFTAMAALLVTLFAWIYETQRTHTEKRLRLAKETAEEANLAKDQFLANMSHEIRTPAGAILGVAQLLARSDLSVRDREYVETLETSTDMLLRLIDDILDFSVIEAGKLTLDTRDFALDDAVRQVVTLLTPGAEAKGLGIRLSIADEVRRRVHGDPVRLRQVLVNLIGNALKFTDRGTIDVRVERAHPESGRYELRFLVRDTGIGMPQEFLSQLFSPFTQADPSTTRRHGGAGLGLSISQRLVKMMGGEIGVDSTQGIGSTFSFTLPFDPPSRSSQLAETQPFRGRPAAAQGRILLADDNTVNRMVTSTQIVALGYEVVAVADGQTALEAFDDGSYDLVLLDCQMPVLDGYEVCRRIRQSDNGQLPVVAITAHAMPGDREKCLAAGMDDYIAKPYKETTLASVLGRWIQPASDAGRAATLGGKACIDCRPYSNTGAGIAGRLDLHRVESLRSLGILHQTLDLFLAATPMALGELDEAIKGCEAEASQRGAHQLRGSSTSLGAGAFGKLLEDIEALAQEGRWYEAGVKLRDAETEFEALAMILRRILTAGDEGDPVEADRARTD